jgi:hypothetical protein
MQASKQAPGSSGARRSQEAVTHRRRSACILSILLLGTIFCMKTITKGHKYELESFEGGPSQTLQFIEKTPDSDDPKRLVTVNDGTTNEEVLAMLIDRMKTLQDKFPCRENALVITKLEESLMWLNKRTADRVTRGVEGKQVA